MRISDWSSDVCSSDLTNAEVGRPAFTGRAGGVAIAEVVPNDAAGDGEAAEADREAAADAVGIVFRLVVSAGPRTDHARLEAEPVELALVDDAGAGVVVEANRVVRAADAAGSGGTTGSVSGRGSGGPAGKRLRGAVTL